MYFAPVFENINKKRTLAQVQQHEAHLKKDSAKKKRVDSELGRAHAKKQLKEQASAAKKNTGQGSMMNSAAKDQDPKERIADEFARSNKLFEQSQNRETLIQMMSFNEGKIKRIMERMKMCDEDSTKYADFLAKLEAAEETQEKLMEQLSSFTSGDVINDNDFETPKRQGE